MVVAVVVAIAAAVAEVKNPAADFVQILCKSVLLI